MKKFAILLSTIFVILPSFAFADGVQKQNVVLFPVEQSSSAFSQASHFPIYQPLGTGISGNATRLRITVAGCVAGVGCAAGGTLSEGFYFWKCDTSDYNSCTSLGGAKGSLTVPHPSAKQTYDVTLTGVTFDPTKYYVLQTDFNVLMFHYGSTATSSFPDNPYGLVSTIGTGSAPPPLNDTIKQLAFQLYTDAVNTDQSHVVSVTPYLHESTTTSPTLATQVHISQPDLDNGSVTVTVQLMDLNIIKLLPSDGVTTLYTGTQTTAGEFYYSTTTTLNSGNYALKSLVQYTGGANYIQNTFIAGTSTVIGKAQSGTVDEFNSFYSSLTATTTDGYAGQCAVWNVGSAAFHDCIAYLFVPSSNFIGQGITTLGSLVASAAPFGYGTLFANTWRTGATTSAVSALPVLSFTLPTGYPGAGTVIPLTPWSKLLGDGTILSTATNPNTGHTIRQIVEPGWDNFVYFLFLLALMGEFLGIGYETLNFEARERRNFGIATQRFEHKVRRHGTR